MQKMDMQLKLKHLPVHSSLVGEVHVREAAVFASLAIIEHPHKLWLQAAEQRFNGGLVCLPWNVTDVGHGVACHPAWSCALIAPCSSPSTCAIDASLLGSSILACCYVLDASSKAKKTSTTMLYAYAARLYMERY